MPRLSSTARVALLACALATLGAACGRTKDEAVDPDGGAGSLTCNVAPPTACPDPMPHYPDVAPIIARHCIECHYGAVGGPWPLLEYGHVADWKDLVWAVLLDCSMPPGDASAPMTNEERMAVLSWIRCGYPR